MRPTYIALLLCTAILTGCAGTDTGVGAHAGDAYIVKSAHTLYYSYGPAQASGPDSSLPRGTRLLMLSREYGFSHIAIAGTGQTGYVSTDDLAPAPPLPKPAPLPTPVRHHRIMEEEPLSTPDNPDKIPLPVFEDTLPPPNAPPFRY